MTSKPTLENLLQDCTVKLSIPGQQGWGTGFFVAPGWILTCAHVVQQANQPLQLRWRAEENWGQAVVAQSVAKPYDLALLRVILPLETNHPCVDLGESPPESRDPLYLFGYPDRDFDNGCPVTFDCEGLTGDEPALIKFGLGQVRPGMSGSALLNQKTGQVCGIVQFTRDKGFDLGGGGVTVVTILDQFPALKSLNQQFHQQDDRWRSLLPKLQAEASQTGGFVQSGWTVHGDVNQAQRDVVINKGSEVFNEVFNNDLRGARIGNFANQLRGNARQVNQAEEE